MDNRNNNMKFPSVDQILEQKIYDRRIFSSLVSRNAFERSENIPGRLTQDGEYGVIYNILRGRDAEGMSSRVITEELAERMSLDEEGLHEIATRNTPELFPPKVIRMADALKGYEAEGGAETGENIQMGMFDMPSMQDLYVVSNETGFLGAGAIYNEDKKVLQELSENLQSDLIVLPSSIHEMLVTPDNGKLEAPELEEMIKDVNTTEVMPHEILGWKAMHYDRDTNELSVLKDQHCPSREQNKQQKRERHNNHRMRRGGR